MRDKNANDAIDELIRGRIQVEVPADVEDRLRHRLMEFRARVEQRPSGRLRVLGYSLLHRPVVRVMAMSAALALAASVALVLIPTQTRVSRVFAAAAERLRSSQSLEYTIVLNAEPYVAVDFAYLAPGYRRISCSWGIEVRSDASAGKQLVLMHATRKYLVESRKQAESLANTEDIAEQLRSLPSVADEVLGEQWAGGKRLIGYRLRKAQPNTGIPGLTAFDIWIDAGTREAQRVDIAIQEEGKPVHQMQIRNIRAGAEIDRSLFDLTPPAGYTAIMAPGAKPPAGPPGSSQNQGALHVTIGYAAALAAVVMPMKGSYLQTSAALHTVEAYLKTQGIAPVGPPLGRYWSEQRWEAGYPVPPGAHVEAPFDLISLPAELTASAVVKGLWGKDSDGLSAGRPRHGDLVRRGFQGVDPIHRNAHACGESELK
jgi:outer membrane lipoprotein-sorting protein